MIYNVHHEYELFALTHLPIIVPVKQLTKSDYNYGKSQMMFRLGVLRLQHIFKSDENGRSVWMSGTQWAISKYELLKLKFKFKLSWEWKRTNERAPARLMYFSKMLNFDTANGRAFFGWTSCNLFLGMSELWLTNEKLFSLLSTALPFLSHSLPRHVMCVCGFVELFFSFAFLFCVWPISFFFPPRSIRNGNIISFGQTISITRRFAFIQVHSHSHSHVNCKVYHIFKSF